MQQPEKKHYTMTGGPKGLPLIGNLLAVHRDPLDLLARNAVKYGDVIPITLPGFGSVQINHPELIQYVLMENHKNYKKSAVYVRFEAALGQGLLTSNGEKWRRDRQKIQPMFKREQIEGYFFDVINDVAEKYKHRWLQLTEHGPAEIDITQEMALITIEAILKAIFGKSAMDDETVSKIHHSFVVFIEYLKSMRIFPYIDFDQVFHTGRYRHFKQEKLRLQNIIQELLIRYRMDSNQDKYNFLALLYEAQKQDPEHFTDQDIMDQCLTMIFGGFESTSILMQWMWYQLDIRPDVAEKLRHEITSCAPATATYARANLTHDDIHKMNYLTAVFKESMRLYPPFWVSSRQPIEDDWLGDFKIKRGTVVVLPQIVMHRHPRWWNEPNVFIPERFMGNQEEAIHPGLYFPFSQGPRKCIGYKLVEMEAKIVFAVLLPLFKVSALNVVENEICPSISLKMKYPLRVRIKRT